MKKLLIILMTMLLLTACSSTETDIDTRNDDGTPIWATEVPESKKYLYGVGSANLGNTTDSQKASELLARAELARRLQTTVKEATSLFSERSQSYNASSYESINTQLVDFTLQGVRIEQRYTAADGTVWTLVSLEAKQLEAQYSIAANSYVNQLEAKKADIEAKKVAAIADIARQLEEANVTLANAEASKDTAAISAAYKALEAKQTESEQLLDAVTSYAASESEKLDEEIRAIDIEGALKAISEELAREGYTE